MIGRSDERVLLEGMLADARSGQSGTLVLSGEPGVGKSELLAYAIALSDGFLVLRATGVESEVDLVIITGVVVDWIDEPDGSITLMIEAQPM